MLIGTGGTQEVPGVILHRAVAATGCTIKTESGTVRVFAFGFLVAFEIPPVEIGGTGKAQFVGAE